MIIGTHKERELTILVSHPPPSTESMSKMHQQIDQLMRDVVEWKEKEDKSDMIVIIIELLDKKIKKKINN